MGHDAGDELLVEVAQRLASVIRPGDTVARFGGDEFTILCEDLTPGTARDLAVEISQRLLATVISPMVVRGTEMFVWYAIAELVAAVDECVRDPSVGVIVIRGAGRAFAAGADASPSGAMRDRSANTNREELLDELWGRFQCLWDAPKPVIAQVHGY